MDSQPDVVEIRTAHGAARVHLRAVEDHRGLLMLGHGAGGGVEAPDLRTTSDVARASGWSVALVEQPYRVAGRRAPAPARQLDAAWTDVALHLLAGPFAGLPLVVGGRSSGARVACRTARVLGAVGVLCLAFPLQPPGKADRPSRLPELEDVDVPTLVVQGQRDAFGMPPAALGRTVVVVDGDHSLKKDQAAVGDAVRAWLGGLTPSSSTVTTA
ncbi:alpha/beta family hydrolase [Georgenia sp. H159]|uniref:alpha/beta hydrolase family protein n=1 Tax=Georgenia sp. H159 TaxID=3076115 RepID=UPI002D7A00C0|nr:alpha/beta family hydrolase [Georgenia sp. H159]